LRPAAHFRNSTNVRHTIDPQYLQDLPFNDSLLLAAVSANPIASNLSPELQKHLALEVKYSSKEALLGFNVLYNLCKEYSNFLFAEIHQLCFGGRYRAVALASTDGLSVNSPALLTFQPLYVPVGDITLGRIFNVLGATMDGWFQLNNNGLTSRYKSHASQLHNVN
jgi:hypothetical protein